jgi:hypothetical protein
VPDFLNAIELFWLYNSSLVSKKSENSTNKNNAVGACIAIVDGNLNKNNVKNLIKTRLISADQRTNQRFMVRFRQRLYRILAYGYVWLDCDENLFDLDDHICEIKSTNGAEGSEELKNDDQLQAYVSHLISTYEFNIEKPLWKLFYKQNFGFNVNGEKRTVLIFLFHMCFADGLSLIRVFFKSLVDNRNAIEIKPRFAYNLFRIELIQQFIFNMKHLFYLVFLKSKDKNPLHKESMKSSCFSELKTFASINVSSPSSSCRSSLSSSSSSSLRAPNNNTSNGLQMNNIEKKPSPYQNVLWSKPFSLITLNRMKMVTRSKLNDLLVSVVAGCIRTYLNKKGINHPKDMHCLMPIDLTSNKYPFKLGNNAAISSFKLATNTEGCIPRLWTTKKKTSKLKSSGNYLLLHVFIYIMFKMLPNGLAAWITRKVINKNTVVAATLGAGDSSLSTVTLCNQNVRELIFLYPTVCDLALSFSILTYGEEVRLALITDNSVIKNPQFIVREFNKQVIYDYYY